MTAEVRHLDDYRPPPDCPDLGPGATPLLWVLPWRIFQQIYQDARRALGWLRPKENR